jgi:hypothetical protein
MITQHTKIILLLLLFILLLTNRLQDTQQTAHTLIGLLKKTVCNITGTTRRESKQRILLGFELGPSKMKRM